MKIFCKFSSIYIYQNVFFLLVICIAKNFIWTTLKVIFSIFAPSDSRFSNSCIPDKYYPICPNKKKMTLMFYVPWSDVCFYFRFTFFHGGTLIYKWNTKLTFIWKEDFGALSNSPVLLLRSAGKMLLTMFLVQTWLVALFLKISERGDSWFSFSSFLVKLSRVFESALLDCILKLAVIPVACAHFPSQFLPSSQLCI